MNWRAIRLLFPVFCSLISVPQLHAQADDDPFFYVDLSEPPLDASAFKIEDDVLEAVRNGATILSRNIRIKNRMRAQLLAVALLIDPEHQLALQTNIILRQKESPPPVNITDPATNQPIDLSLIAADLMAGTYAIYAASDNSKNKDALLLTAMLYDICRSLFPADEELKYSHDVFLQSNPPAPWDAVLKPSDGSSASPTIKPGMHEAAVGGIALKSTRAAVKAMLDLEGAHAPVLMRVKHLENVSDDKSIRRMRFDGDVDEQLLIPLPIIANFMTPRHGDWVKEGIVEFSFDDKAVKLAHFVDALLPCALLAEGMVTGRAIDEDAVCAGSMNPDGTLLAAHKPLGKLQAAQKSSCRVFVLPAANRATLTDAVLLGDAGSLAQMQVFVAAKFDDAWNAVQAERLPEIQASMDDFAKLQTKFKSDGVLAAIRVDSNLQLLRDIVERTPNHGSAVVILAAAEGRLPTKISLNGSLESLGETYDRLLKLIDKNDLTPRSNSELSSFQAVVAELKRRQPKLDPQTQALVAELIKLAEALEGQSRVGGAAPGSQLRTRAETSARAFVSEFQKLQP